jgi:hypothetical protein
MAFLIDKYLPAFTYNEFHKTLVNATAGECFVTTKHLDLSKSFITKSLLKLRGLPTQDLTLQGFLKKICFTYVEEDINNEFVIDASQPGIKIYWNFYFEKIEDNKTLVSTETRILCLTKRSKFRFSLYWVFIKPFSGLTRIEMLRLIKKNAERK